MSTTPPAHCLSVNGRVLNLPLFFPAISSVKSDWNLLDLLRGLDARHPPLLLVSAYDIARAPEKDREAIKATVGRMTSKDTAVLLDSGNYESYWLRDAAWKQADYAGVLRCGLTGIAFSYDDQNPADTVELSVEQAVGAVIRDQSVVKKTTVLPIVHSRQDCMAATALEVARKLRPIMLAIPERELGRGIVERTRTLRGVRIALDELDFSCPIHLLGTGNPLSILTYAMCGADSFDGLEWYRTAVDPATARLYHFHQLELIERQGPEPAIASADYDVAVLVNNLSFYLDWMGRIRAARLNGGLREFAAKYIPERALNNLPALPAGGGTR